MSDDNAATAATSANQLTVLNADIAGSTRLYEKHGDAVAQEAIASCLSLLSEVVVRSGGRVVKTIGDEIQCVFEDPAEAMIAGTDMQPELMQAGEAGRFATGPLRIKVGMHLGPAFESEGELHGEAGIVAEEITGLAKADQVLASMATLEAVPNALRVGARHFDRIRIKGLTDAFEVCELIWDDISITQEATYRPPREKSRTVQVLLTYNGKEFEISEARSTLTIGRIKDNDVVIPLTQTSRMHAEMTFRRGRCYLTDSSVNGTLVIQDDGRNIFLRREHMALEGSGRICFGGTPEKHPDSVLTYRCVTDPA